MNTNVLVDVSISALKPRLVNREMFDVRWDGIVETKEKISNYDTAFEVALVGKVKQKSFQRWRNDL